jgi:hypothetical protein
MTVPPPESYPPPEGYQPPYNPIQPGQPEQPAYPPPPPGYGGAPAGYGVPPTGYSAPPPKKSNTLRTVLIVVGIVAVLCCGGLIGGGFWLASTVKNAIGPAQDAAVAFVQDLERDDAGSAYGKLCPATRSRFDREGFVAGVSAQPRIVRHEVTGVNVNSNNGVTTATVTMALTQEGGFVDQHTFRMVTEDGTWYVCGNPY